MESDSSTQFLEDDSNTEIPFKKQKKEDAAITTHSASSSRNYSHHKKYCLVVQMHSELELDKYLRALNYYDFKDPSLGHSVTKSAAATVYKHFLNVHTNNIEVFLAIKNLQICVVDGFASRIKVHNSCSYICATLVLVNIPRNITEAAVKRFLDHAGNSNIFNL